MSEKQLFEVFSPKSGEVVAVPTILKMAIIHYQGIKKICGSKKLRGLIILICLKIIFKVIKAIKGILSR